MCRIKNINVFDELERNPSLFKADIATLMNEQPFKDGVYTVHRAALPFEMCTEGEFYLASQGAGGGYGDVIDRDPERVIKDIEEGLVSHETARNLFCIVYDEHTLVVDQAATAAARKARRAERVNQGVPYDEFVSKWVTATPPTDMPYFGGWGSDNETLYANSAKGTPETLPLIMMPDPKDVEIAALKKEIEALKARASGAKTA